MRNFKSKILNSSSGFTVIELIIAVGLFISLFGIVSGSFVNAMRTERKLVAMVAANDSMNTSIEQMAREIRTASNFTSSAPENLQFINYKGEDVTYALALVGARGVIERTVLGLPPKEITADNVDVKTLSFILCDAPACLTSRITIVLGASPADPSLASVVLNLQTTVSARF